MKQSVNIFTAGGDRRFALLASRLAAKDAARVYSLGQGQFPAAGAHPERLERLSALKTAPDLLVLPLPLTTDGETLSMPLEPEQTVSLRAMLDICHPHTRIYCGLTPAGETFKQECRRRGLRLVDYQADEQFALRGADATAEGAISLAVQLLPVTVRNCHVLITGGGRIARSLVRILTTMGAHVSLAARSSAERTEAELLLARTYPLTNLVTLLPQQQLICNTIPAPIFGREEIAAIPEDTLLLELASAPGGFEPAALQEYARPIVRALSLPGKMAPVSSAAWLEALILEKEAEFAGRFIGL